MQCRDDLALRVYTSRLLGRDKSLVLHGGGNTSKDIQLVEPGYSADEDTIKALGDTLLGAFNSNHWAHDLDNAENNSSDSHRNAAPRPPPAARYGPVTDRNAFPGHPAASYPNAISS